MDGHEISHMNGAIGWLTYTFNVSEKREAEKVQLFCKMNCGSIFFETGPKTDVISQLQNGLLNVINSVEPLESIQFHPVDDLHISVTRTVVLRHHWIDEFVRSIENNLKNAHR